MSYLWLLVDKADWTGALNQMVHVPDITAMVCGDCGEMYFDYAEFERISEYVHEAVDGNGD